MPKLTKVEGGYELEGKPVHDGSVLHYYPAGAGNSSAQVTVHIGHDTVWLTSVSMPALLEAEEGMRNGGKVPNIDEVSSKLGVDAFAAELSWSHR